MDGMGAAPIRGETGAGAGRKGRTNNKRGGGGTVANHFYDAQASQAANDSNLVGEMGGDYTGGMN